VPIRTTSLAITVCLLAVACVPSGDEASPTATSAEPSTSTTAPDKSGSDKDRPPTPDTSGPSGDRLEPPKRGDPDDVAADVFRDAGDFELAGESDQFDQDALTAIEQWLPADLVDGFVWEVYTDGRGTNVLAVSVIPTLTWRGDPNLVPTLIATLTDTEPDEIEEGIFRTETEGGLVLHAWSTGDGFVISASMDTARAITYLKDLGADSQSQRVWEPGTCLYTDPESETLPYAPFPPDIVVPCDGPHNAEVLMSQQIGIDIDEFDDEAIEYHRNYQCDVAYNEVFGSQKDHTPTLITYMPDEDEWDRGDRYLTCVVQIDSIDGLELMAGPMADRTDLDWNPDPGNCLDRSFAPTTVDCASRHGYQYLGEATVAFDDWPQDGTSAFQDACSDLLDDFIRKGPARVDVFATGLFPYAFELGDRTVQCMAFAIEDGFLVDVAGSFGDVWRVMGSGGIAT